MNRSGTLPRKDTKRLLDSLRKQGCHIRHMKKGYRVEFPNGGSTMIHLTNSDTRGTLNTRAEIRRAGLIYPGDEKKESRKMAGRQLTDEQQAALREVLTRIKTEGRFFGSVAEMAAKAGVSEHTLNRRLHNLGWTTKGAGPSLVWYAPGARPPLEPTPKPEYPEIEAARREAAERARGSLPFVDVSKFTGNLRTIEAPTVTLEQVKDRIASIRATKPEREFIDSVESWTISVPDKLRLRAEEMGLNIEVRVWR